MVLTDIQKLYETRTGTTPVLVKILTSHIRTNIKTFQAQRSVDLSICGHFYVSLHIYQVSVSSNLIHMMTFNT